MLVIQHIQVYCPEFYLQQWFKDAHCRAVLRKCYHSLHRACLNCLNCLSCPCSVEAVRLIFNPLQLSPSYLFPVFFFPPSCLFCPLSYFTHTRVFPSAVAVFAFLRWVAETKMERRWLASSHLYLSCHVRFLKHCIRLWLSDYLEQIVSKINGVVIGNVDIMQCEYSEANSLLPLFLSLL